MHVFVCVLCCLTHHLNCVDLGTTSGHGISQRREGESSSPHLTSHVLCFPLPEEPQVTCVTLTALVS